MVYRGLAASCFLSGAVAKISQNRLYSDDMVLQSREAYDIRPFVTGFGDTLGEEVRVKFRSHTYQTTVSKDGTWAVQMNTCDALTGETLVVEGDENKLSYANVACGQVFVCSGQSNMELPLSFVFGGEEEIAKADRPNLRLFRVPHATADEPQTDMTEEDPNTGLPATWLVSNQSIAAKFSATCYLTARHISEMLWGDTPIGLIWSAYGGTRVEAWAPKSTVEVCGADSDPTQTGQQGYSQLYNAMIHPLTGYSVRGAFWFQGEHNVVTDTSRKDYSCIFGAMINEWRDAWTGIGDFPFIYAQLAPFTGYAPFPGNGDVSRLRLAQADALPKTGLDTTGMAVTIDLGDPTSPRGDVHSRHKDEVAYRLALQAMHVAYAYQEGENVTNLEHPELTPQPFPLHFSGPLARSAVRAGDGVARAVLTFDFGEALYVNKTLGCEEHRGVGFDGQVIGGECCAAKDTFQVCTGDEFNSTLDMRCENATSVSLDNNVVTLKWDSSLIDPTSVRHAYSNYPQCSLYNSHALPASPFLMELAAASTSVKQQLVVSAPVQKKGFVATPPMGLNSWNAFHCNVDERKMRAMADALVSTGLAEVGFEYVNIDDCWQVMRSPDGRINADATRFPGGIKPLADYIHSLGLKFGVYTAQRSLTCQRRPGSFMHEESDVESYCDWGVDYLKLDNCDGEKYDQTNTSWIKFRAAIDKCSERRGFPMVLSVESCDDPDGCGTWVGGLANLWRTCGDIQGTFGSVMKNVKQNTKMARWAGPTGGPLAGGHWNDADMLQVGNIGLSLIEQYSHYALWVLMASPLLIGTDVSMLSEDSLKIMGNAEVNAVNQDAFGVQGIPVGDNLDPATAPCWAKPLSDGSVAGLLLNVGDNAANVTCTMADFGFATPAAGVRDLWAGEDLAPPHDMAITVELPAHGCKLLKVTGTSPLFV